MPIPTDEKSPQDLEILKQKVKALYDLEVGVHIKLRNHSFKNGKIKKILADFFIVDDRQRGDEFIFYLEVVSIDIYKEPEQREINRGDHDTKMSK